MHLVFAGEDSYFYLAESAEFPFQNLKRIKLGEAPAFFYFADAAS